jgi:hypothetical protein
MGDAAVTQGVDDPFHDTAGLRAMGRSMVPLSGEKTSRYNPQILLMHHPRLHLPD